MPNPIIKSVRLSVDELLDNGVFLIELVVLNLSERPDVTVFRRPRVDRSVDGGLGSLLRRIDIRWSEDKPHLVGVQFLDIPNKKAVEKAVKKAVKKTGQRADTKTLGKAVNKAIEKSAASTSTVLMPDETEIVIVVSNGSGNDPTAVYP